MIARNTLGENGKPILEYIPETESDLEEIYAMIVDGKIPEPSSEPQQPMQLVLTD